MKNPKIQIIRAISIIAVVMIHTCPGGKFQIWVRPFINFSVATFLFLSGYLTDVSKINTKQFYKKRISRVIIPYTIWSFLYTTVGFYSNGINFKQYITNYLFAGGASTLYYIFVYIQFVILTPFLGKLLHKKYWYVGFFVAPLTLIINYYWLLSGVVPNNFISSIWGICCLGWFTFYYLGLYLGNVAKNKKYNVNSLILIYALTICVQIVEGYIWYKFNNGNCGTQLKLSSLLTSSIFILIAYCYVNDKKFKATNKLLLFIGDHSFGIYISHIMVLLILDKIIPFWGSLPFIINSIIVLILTMLCIIIGKKICGDKISKYLGLY